MKTKQLLNFYGINLCFLLSGLLLGISACQSLENQTNSDTKATKVTGRSDTQLVLNNAILEQSSVKGNWQWKIKSEQTVYSNDRQTANLEKVTANLLQDGKIILKVKGDQGKVLEQGNLVFLQGNVVATDARNETIIQGDLVEWRPQEHILVLSQNFSGTHQNVKLRAEKATYFTDQEKLEVSGQIIADNIEPWLQLKTERLVWHIPQQKILGNTPWKVIHYQEKIVTERLVADGGEWDLENQTMTLKENIELIALSPQLQIAMDSATWNYQKRTIISDRPMQILDRQRQVTITGNQGNLDLITNIANLTQGVQGKRKVNPAQFYANDLTWNIPAQTIEATGNVFYEQTSPTLELRGDRAFIKLPENKVVISSNQNNQRGVISIVGDR